MLALQNLPLTVPHHNVAAISQSQHQVLPPHLENVVVPVLVLLHLTLIQPIPCHLGDDDSPVLVQEVRPPIGFDTALHLREGAMIPVVLKAALRTILPCPGDGENR